MRRTVLVAEGDVHLCEEFRWLLAERGYEVETAADGLSCLERLRRTMPALLVLDREIPWGDGVLDRLRERNPTAGAAVVLTTTDGHPEEFPGIVRPPVVALLRKPFPLAALLELVRAAVAASGRDGRSSGERAAISEPYIG